jgi:hypothetical protein
MVAALAWWLFARSGNAQIRRASDHVLLTTLVASALPHALKKIFDPQRPDRQTALGHLRGIPLGHAVHIGALASGGGMTAYALATRGARVLHHARRHGAIGFFAGTLSGRWLSRFSRTARSLPLRPVVALRETNVIFGSLIGTFVLKEAFGLRRIAASTFVVAGIAVLALNR